jgi:hypothetical protein
MDGTAHVYQEMESGKQRNLLSNMQEVTLSACVLIRLLSSFILWLEARLFFRVFNSFYI